MSIASANALAFQSASIANASIANAFPLLNISRSTNQTFSSTKRRPKQKPKEEPTENIELVRKVVKTRLEALKMLEPSHPFLSTMVWDYLFGKKELTTAVVEFKASNHTVSENTIAVFSRLRNSVLPKPEELALQLMSSKPNSILSGVTLGLVNFYAQNSNSYVDLSRAMDWSKYVLAHSSWVLSTAATAGALVVGFNLAPAVSMAALPMGALYAIGGGKMATVLLVSDYVGDLSMAYVARSVDEQLSPIRDDPVYRHIISAELEGIDIVQQLKTDLAVEIQLVQQKVRQRFLDDDELFLKLAAAKLPALQLGAPEQARIAPPDVTVSILGENGKNALQSYYNSSNAPANDPMGVTFQGVQFGSIPRAQAQEIFLAGVDIGIDIGVREGFQLCQAGQTFNFVTQLSNDRVTDHLSQTWWQQMGKRNIAQAEAKLQYAEEKVQQAASIRDTVCSWVRDAGTWIVETFPQLYQWAKSAYWLVSVLFNAGKGLFGLLWNNPMYLAAFVSGLVAFFASVAFIYIRLKYMIVKNAKNYVMEKTINTLNAALSGNVDAAKAIPNDVLIAMMQSVLDTDKRPSQIQNQLKRELNSNGGGPPAFMTALQNSREPGKMIVKGNASIDLPFEVKPEPTEFFKYELAQPDSIFSSWFYGYDMFPGISHLDPVVASKYRIRKKDALHLFTLAL